MNRTLLRRAAIAAAVLLAILVVAGGVFTATFDVNRYKPEIVAAVQERTGRTLRFEGDLSLSLFPRIAVKLPATTLSEPRRDAVFARLQSAQAAVELLPLLRRELVIDSVRVDGLQATVVRQKDGTTNIDDLLKTPPPSSAAGKGGPAPPPAATIGGVQLKNADVTWRDLAAGRTVRLHGFDLRAGRYAAGARMPLEASAAITASEPALDARLSVAADIEWADEGGLRAVRSLAVKGDGTLRQQPVSIDARAEQLVMGADLLEVRGLRVSAGGKGEGGAALEMQLVAPRLEASKARAVADRIDLTLARRGAEPLDAKVTIDGVRGNAARLEATAVKIAGTAKTGARSTRFDMATALAASVNDRTLHIERATGEFVIEDPALGPKPVRLPLAASGAVDGRRETVAVQFDSRGEGLIVRGKVDLNGFAQPRIAFDVDAEQIDVDRYLPPAPKAAAGGKPTPAPGPAAGTSVDTKVDFGALRGVTAAGNIRVARLRVKGNEVSDLRAALKAADGRLDVAPLSLRAHGGSVAGRVSLDARNNRVAANGTINGVQLRRLVADIGGRAALEGSANGTFDLATAGSSVGQMKRALGGSLAVDVRDGALVGIDLADLIGTAAGFLQSRGRQTGALDENKRTPFTQLSATVRIKDGVASNDDLKAKSPQLDIAGSGRMDLVSTELDYALRAQVLAAPATERSALRSLAGVTVPVRIAGPIERPTYAVDWGAVAADALLKRATGRAGTPSVDQVIEGLGGLLGRRKK